MEKERTKVLATKKEKKKTLMTIVTQKW